MTTQIGDEIMITSQEPQQLVRSGEIRGVLDDPDGVVYLVQWSDTGHETLLPPGPDVVIMRRRSRDGRGSVGAAPLLSRLRQLLEWRHRRYLERRQQIRNEYLARRVQGIIAGLGLNHTDFSIGGGRVIHVPEVVSVAAGPPVGLNIRTLPGQIPDDFAAHAPAIAYNLGVAEVRVIPLGPDRVRLELLPGDPQPGYPRASR